MVIYKTINKLNGRYYIGKDAANKAYYYGSGKLITQAIKKYGKENFEKIILEECKDLEHLSEREKHWIKETNAINDPLSYNLAAGGQGGDLSKFHDYEKHRGKNDKFSGAIKWLQGLTEDQRKEWHAKQAEKRTKGWYVSRIDDPTEIYVQNISKWCDEHGVDKGAPSAMNTPSSPMFQKQSKGWRIRRSDMPLLPPYENRRHIPTDNKCKGKTWKLVDGTRVWFDK